MYREDGKVGFDARWADAGIGAVVGLLGRLNGVRLPISTSILLVVGATKLPRVAAVAVIMAINVGLYWYALSVFQRRYQQQHPRSDRRSPPDASPR
jgi:hypothetical protein